MKKLGLVLIPILVSLSVRLSPAFAETKTVTTNTSASVGSILELTISQAGQSELRFGNIQPSAIDTKETGPVVIVIDVKSNTGERYQVTQNITSALANSNGDQIDIANLKFKTSSASSSGTAVNSPIAVSTASQIIFTSDSQGASDTIKAEYTLTIPPAQASGDYSALLTYTVSSL